MVRLSYIGRAVAGNPSRCRSPSLISSTLSDRKRSSDTHRSPLSDLRREDRHSRRPRPRTACPAQFPLPWLGPKLVRQGRHVDGRGAGTGRHAWRANAATKFSGGQIARAATFYDSSLALWDPVEPSRRRSDEDPSSPVGWRALRSEGWKWESSRTDPSRSGRVEGRRMEGWKGG